MNDPRQRYRVAFDIALERGEVDPALLAAGKCEPWNAYLQAAALIERPPEEWELERWYAVPHLILHTASGPVRIEPAISRFIPTNEVVLRGRRGSTLARHIDSESPDGILQAVHDFMTWGEDVELVMVNPRTFALLQADVAAIGRFGLDRDARLQHFIDADGDPAIITAAHLILAVEPTDQTVAFCQRVMESPTHRTSLQVASALATWMLLPNHEYLSEQAARERAGIETRLRNPFSPENGFTFLGR